jgi:hypothetical protein
MSRLKSAAFVALLLLTVAPAHHAFAQMPGGQGGGGGGGGGPDTSGADDEAKKRQRDEEWGNAQAPLPQLRNAGPCPYVKVLYDAGRYQEFKDKKESAAAVAYTGEIQGVSSACTYKGADPIKVSVQMLFALGRGSQGTSSSKTYRYWIAVTQRNLRVITKEYFDLPVDFAAGQDRAMITETIQDITIPRADIKVSGSNFEVLVGFDVTPEMAAFNRDGKRFRVNVQASAASTAPTTP